jgi:hypothetical protein
MRTVTVDILKDEAFNLLKDLETLKVIRLHNIEDENQEHAINSIKKYKGLMSKQTLEEIDQQLSELRKEWD